MYRIWGVVKRQVEGRVGVEVGQDLKVDLGPGVLDWKQGAAEGRITSLTGDWSS